MNGSQHGAGPNILAAPSEGRASGQERGDCLGVPLLPSGWQALPTPTNPEGEGLQAQHPPGRTPNLAGSNPEFVFRVRAPEPCPSCHSTPPAGLDALPGLGVACPTLPAASALPPAWPPRASCLMQVSRPPRFAPPPHRLPRLARRRLLRPLCPQPHRHCPHHGHRVHLEDGQVDGVSADRNSGRHCCARQCQPCPAGPTVAAWPWKHFALSDVLLSRCASARP